jgi:NAD(P)-dependent dehydrogenase (short-subunit alcohol dehydrogenase family)
MRTSLAADGGRAWVPSVHRLARALVARRGDAERGPCQRTPSHHPGATMHTIVMTGATRGIGRFAAARILRDDPEAHLVVISRGTPDDDRTRVSHVAADLGSLAEVRAAASDVARRMDAGELPPLRGFVGNAGIQYTNAHTKGADGYEATFTVNVLANHVLLRTLMDRFVARHAWSSRRATPTSGTSRTPWASCPHPGGRRPRRSPGRARSRRRTGRRAGGAPTPRASSAPSTSRTSTHAGCRQA